MECSRFIVGSTLASWILAEAMLGRLGSIAPRRETMEHLASLFDAPALRTAIARFGGPVPEEDGWGLPRCRLEHLRPAVTRIAGVVEFLAGEMQGSATSARFASWTFETVTDIRGLFEDDAACERAAEKDHDPAGIPTSCPMIAAAVAARPELMQALERAAIRIAVLERPTASDATRQALGDGMDARPGVYRRLAQ